MNKAKLKEAIENYEYKHSGISYNNGSYAKAVNILHEVEDKTGYAIKPLAKAITLLMGLNLNPN